jgi:NAD(P)-dependent dehydrogenase (short-subunit alcohol dehydrogenase family)
MWAQVKNPPATKVVVITGSTRGIGFGLADAFLGLGCAVCVSGRSQERVDGALVQLAARHSPERMCGRVCDVTDFGHLDQQRWPWPPADPAVGLYA